MLITGIGTLGTFGCGKQVLMNAVETNKTIDPYDCLNVDIKAAADKSLFKKLRRADRFTKMAVIAVDDALKDSLNGVINVKNTGIIVATAFGPHNTTFAFLDDLLKYGEKNVSPIKFSNSVHNAAASYIAQLFGIRGPVTTITNFKNPVENAFAIASCWLNSNMCENILLCSVDEKGEIYNQAFDEILNNGEKKLYATEGSCCFLLQKESNERALAYSTVETLCHDDRSRKELELTIGSTKSLSSNKAIHKNASIDDYSSIYGNMITGISFDCAITALGLKKTEERS